MSAAQTASSIEVAVRVRPMRGDLHESKAAWRVDATTLTELAQPDNVFTFDRVYDVAATTAEVYKRHVRGSIVARVAQGYNGTVFAYGQTGSGKSYTMFGDAAARSPGLIRLAVHDLFKALAAEQQQKPYIHTEVFVSVLEIYNEQLRDLLRGDVEAGPASVAAARGPAASTSSAAAAAAGAAGSSASPASAASASPPPLSIRENEHGVYVHNALRTRVASEQQCTAAIYAHAASRVSAATAMNEHSSRSHCVIRVTVERSHYLEDAAAAAGETEEEEEDDEDGDDEDDAAALRGGDAPTGKAAAAAAKHRKTVLSTLNMVDLAGSERVAKTGATGQRMVEGGHINKSLTTLTTVINRLASEASSNGGGGGGSASSSFIPYRDSRLTHLLKTAIGGNSFTVVLCCITPAIESANESRSTLQFASRAKRIRNRVRVNEVANAQTRVRELEAGLRHAKRLLVAQTLYLWSKQLKIRMYEAQLSDAGHTGPPRQRPVSTTATSTTATASAAAPASPAPLMNQRQQQSMIIAQLTAQNGALAEEVRTLKARVEAAHTGRGNAATPTAPAPAVTAELNTLRQSLVTAQQLLREREAALAATQTSLDELDGLCRELEGDSKAQADTIKTLNARNGEAEELMTAVEEAHTALQQEVSLLRAQLQQSQSRLLEKHRGDDYLAELTRLHVEHQGLQYSYSQLKEKADREKAELLQRLHRLTEQNNTLEDDLDEARDRGQLMNSHLWRLLSAAAQTTRGKPLQIKDPTAMVRDAQVAEAERSLTSFAAMSHSTYRGGGVGGDARSDGNGDVAAGEGVRQLRDRISALEEQLTAKDAQRDVIIDTKLKRIQGLVLRLHTVNVALSAEMRHCFRDNELLLEIAGSSTKTQKKVDKAGLTARSLEAALDRARFAQPPHKPLHHN
ncbi:kinesin [Novymonas esmeraldas]|uniref:Kinesin-like protein n=1 Tax=Novymonas esmeraldas TaxID=1808958 RepID=A0AAW0ESX5_9TRYP